MNKNGIDIENTLTIRVGSQKETGKKGKGWCRVADIERSDLLSWNRYTLTVITISSSTSALNSLTFKQPESYLKNGT